MPKASDTFPLILFPWRLILIRFGQFLKLFGIGPRKWFPPTINLSNAPFRQMLCGKLSVKWLFSNASTVNMRFPIEGGMEPDRLFSKRNKYLRLVKLPTDEGRDPLNWFSPSPSLTRDFKFHVSVGIKPVKWLSRRCISLRLVKLPINGGKKPPNWFFLKSRMIRNLKFPNSLGIEPRTRK